MDAQVIDKELSGLLQSGDQRGAAGILVRAYAADVFACCRALLKDAAAAEDLSQEVFSRAIAGLDGFRQDASARTWLLRIARNCCFDYLTRLSRQPYDVGGEDPDPDAYADEAPPVWELLSRREDAEQALAALGETERAIVVLHFGHGVGYPELAAAFNLREGAVRMRVSRALSRMRDALVPAETAASLASVDHLEGALAPPSASAEGPARGETPRAARSRAGAMPLPPPAAAPPGASPAPKAAKRISWPWPLRAPPAPAPSPEPAASGAGSGSVPGRMPARAGAPAFFGDFLHQQLPPGLAGRLAALVAGAPSAGDGHQ